VQDMGAKIFSGSQKYHTFPFAKKLINLLIYINITMISNGGYISTMSYAKSAVVPVHAAMQKIVSLERTRPVL
jgi:hypothetical protein